MVKIAKRVLTLPAFKVLETHLASVTQEKAEKFSEENRKCWMALSKERDASICQICSGRGNHFFMNDKILVSQAKCAQLSAICRSPMATITSIVAGVEALERISAIIADAGIEVKIDQSGIVESKTAIKDLFAGLDPFQKLLLANPEMSTNEDLCEKFVKMRTPIMLEAMDVILKKITAIQFCMTQELSSFVGRRTNKNYSYTLSAYFPLPTGFCSTQIPKSNWQLKRLLQFNGSPPALGSDATFVNPTDPSYTSIGVSGHSPVPDHSSFP